MHSGSIKCDLSLGNYTKAEVHYCWHATTEKYIISIQSNDSQNYLLNINFSNFR